MAIEQELVDYIKKARAAGQSDGQSRSLLYRNGWTEAEVNEAFNAISQTQAQTPEGPKIQPQYQPQTQQGQQPQQAQSQISRAQSQPQQPQPQPQVQPKPEPQYSKPSYQPSQPSQGNRPAGRSGSHALLKIFVVLIMLAIIGGAGLYYVLSNGIYNPSWNPFGPNPEEVMAKMFAIMQGTELYPMKATATNGSAQADADIIASGGTLYIKFNQLSGLDLYNPDEITGKWFKLENSSIGADLNMASLKNSATFVRQLDDQVIGGQDNYHYLIRVNETDAEIWISKQDYTLYGYKAEKTVDLNQFFTGLSGQLPAKWDVQILGSVDQTPMQKPSDS